MFWFSNIIAVFCDAIFSDLADATERRHFESSNCKVQTNFKATDLKSNTKD